MDTENLPWAHLECFSELKLEVLTLVTWIVFILEKENGRSQWLNLQTWQVWTCGKDVFQWGFCHLTLARCPPLLLSKVRHESRNPCTTQCVCEKSLFSYINAYLSGVIVFAAWHSHWHFILLVSWNFLWLRLLYCLGAFLFFSFIEIVVFLFLFFF